MPDATLRPAGAGGIAAGRPGRSFSIPVGNADRVAPLCSRCGLRRSRHISIAAGRRRSGAAAGFSGIALAARGGSHQAIRLLHRLVVRLRAFRPRALLDLLRAADRCGEVLVDDAVRHSGPSGPARDLRRAGDACAAYRLPPPETVGPCPRPGFRHCLDDVRVPARPCLHRVPVEPDRLFLDRLPSRASKRRSDRHLWAGTADRGGGVAAGASPRSIRVGHAGACERRNRPCSCRCNGSCGLGPIVAGRLHHRSGSRGFGWSSRLSRRR